MAVKRMDAGMKWMHKAAVQNLLGRLPPNLGNAMYYFLQTTYGGLRKPTPMSRLQAGVEIARRIYNTGRSVASKAFVELGTGHQLNLPLSLWLCGASRITTIDLNRYLKQKLVMSDIEYLRNHKTEVRNLYATLPGSQSLEDRLEQLISCASLRELLSLTHIRYLAPADAAHLDLTEESIDYHVSFTVLEHIPPAILEGIFEEGRRLLKPDGLFVHYIDFTDHFAHSDDTISSVNFLQFSESDWEKLAGNRFMFHNRLRIDELRALLLSWGLKILSIDSQVDKIAMDFMKKGFTLDERFRTKDLHTNATMDAWLIASART